MLPSGPPDTWPLPRFGNSVERDTQFAQWVAAGGVLVDGMTCAVDTEQQTRSGGKWVPTYSLEEL